MVDGRAPFTLREAGCHLVQYEGWAGRLAAFEAALSAALGMALPQAVGATQCAADVTAIRVAPRRFWLLYDTDAAPPHAISPADIDPELGCSLALGEGRVRLHLAGAHLRDVLAKCFPVDWTALALAPPRALHTSFHHVPLLLIARAEFACDLLIPRSFTHSLCESLVDAAGEFTRPAP